MEQVTVLQHFDALEKKIEHLIETCRQLEATKAELMQQNNELERQLQEKLAEHQQHQELKGLIRSKIDSLMGRLDELAEG
ncbi:MAG: cell division protein ZapB [Desulfobacteraceae bacterium]